LPIFLGEVGVHFTVGFRGGHSILGVRRKVVTPLRHCVYSSNVSFKHGTWTGGEEFLIGNHKFVRILAEKSTGTLLRSGSKTKKEQSFISRLTTFDFVRDDNIQ
jgi:hypothetical protein